MRNAGHTSQLNLPAATSLNQLLVTNGIIKQRAIPETSQYIQHLGDAIVGKYGDFVNVIESTKPFAIKSSPYICYTNLCSLQKPNTFPVLKTHDIIEAGKVIGKKVDQGRSGVTGFCNAVREAALVLL